MFTCTGFGTSRATDRLAPISFQRLRSIAKRMSQQRRIRDALCRPLLLAITVLTASALHAEEPKGCDAFKWPLNKEAVRLQGADKIAATSATAAKADGSAYDLHLVSLEQAHLPQSPEHKPKMSPSTAGYLDFAAPAAAGAYQIAISQAAWIDIVQGGRYVKPSAFSGAADCPGVRKSIRFDLSAQPFVVQISGTNAANLALLVEPIEP